MTRVVGVVGYVAMLAAGYAYNLTFVQLALTGYARTVLGLDATAVAAAMGGLAVATCAAALAAGFALRGSGLRVKLGVAAAAVLAQTCLTAAIGTVVSPVAFVAWLAAAAAALGVAVPATFGLATDLAPVRWRGWVAAAITALAYGGSIAWLSAWDARELTGRLVPLMGLGAVGLALLAVRAPGLRRLVDELGRQADDPGFARGRFVGPGRRRRVQVAALLLFCVFFVDSLGFVRLSGTAYIAAAWQSPEAIDRAVLVAAHVVGAAVGGALYASFDERLLLPWIFGIFGLVALMYVGDVRLGLAGPSQVLAMPVLYAVGVSLYTVLTFALWADLSTPATVTWTASVGVALSAWTATFLSTAVATAWQAAGVDLDRHMSWVASVPLLGLAAWWLARLLRPTREAVA